MSTEDSEANDDWLEDPDAEDEAEESQIDEYDLTSSPNDFNVSTIANFIDSGAVKIPGFQRHYVWDIKRASKLIESLIIGLPVPQVFLYEESRNSFLVIDGQQRLMTISYFIHQRFPRREKRVELRSLLDNRGNVPQELLDDENFFEDFKLRLPSLANGKKNRFANLTFSTLGDYATQFQLRTIRNIIVKQVKPAEDDSSIYEMFHRLNTGGVNLTPQEIRASINHSSFMDALARLNLDPQWRRIVGQETADLHMRDTELLLRCIAMWQEGETYKASMVRFLNTFAKKGRKFTSSEISDIEASFSWFLDAIRDIPRSSFATRQHKLILPLFEAIFAGSRKLREAGYNTIPADVIDHIRTDPEFARLASAKTADTTNVTKRIQIAQKKLLERARKSGRRQ